VQNIKKYVMPYQYGITRLLKIRNMNNGQYNASLQVRKSQYDGMAF